MTCSCSHCQKQIYPYTHLEEWRKASCFNDPWGFWQWDHDKLRVKGKSSCSSIVRQSNNHHGCPADTLGRDNIALAILEAEQMYRDNLGYPVVPEWHQKEVASFAWGCGQSWRNGDRLVLPYGHIQHVGTEVCQTLGEVVKGDNSYKIEALHGPLPDTFTLSLSGLSNVSEGEIKVYVSKAERTNTCDPLRRWEIPAECVTLDNGTLTITGKAYLLAKPELYESFTPFSVPVSYYGDYSLNPENLDNYIERLEIVRCYVDSCQGGFARFKNTCGCPSCKPDGSHCSTCSNVSFCIENEIAGIVKPLWEWNCQRPSSFCVSYQAGDCSRNWTGDIAKLAIANLCGGICGCAYGCMSRWWDDLASEEAKNKVTFEQLNNPIGSRRGHLHAWNLIQKYQNNIFTV